MNRSASTRCAILSAIVPALLAVTGCGSDDSSDAGTRTIPGLAGGVTCSAPDGAKGPGAGTKAVGFVLSGSKSDRGYNQAVHAGARALGDACKDLKIIESAPVASGADMISAAERMIDDGAKVIFSTNPNLRAAAVALAKKHPDVAVLLQNAVVEPPLPPNLGTYTGSSYETFYLAGVVAATATKSKKLGFVAGSQDPPTLLNVNAFELGAQSIASKAQTHVAFIGGRCDSVKQAAAARRLLEQGADVLAQQQDCTATVIKAAEARDKYSIGLHFDARALAPKGWLTGVESNWAPLFGAIVSSIQKGKFARSDFHDNLVVGFSSTQIPPATRLGRYGPAIDVNTARRVSDARAEILGGRSPFRGPVVDQAGNVRIARGKSATRKQLAAMSYLVRGVVGSIQK
jgi:simple sugar transport system substrate-binding protein/basic membrane protein A